MHTIAFQTGEFPHEPEGELDRNNGQPGSAVAHWLRAALTERGIKTGDPLQEDYGWGFWLDSEAAVWVAISYAGEDSTDEQPVPSTLWYVSVSREIPFFLPHIALRQWLRRHEGREAVKRTFAAIRDAISQHAAIKIVEITEA